MPDSESSYPSLSAQGKRYVHNDEVDFDVILISGDAYVDHPSFPAAVVTRTLQSLGLKVAVIAQPDWKSTEAFMVFGAPRLFFGITAGAMDSMVANYTSRKLPRKQDRLSPGGLSGMRPKRAVQVYAQRVRQAFPKARIVIGGIEASLRRFSHYDYWENRVRAPILMDAPADLLITGMIEGVAEDLVAWALSDGKTLPPYQSSVRVKHGSWQEWLQQPSMILPAVSECQSSPAALLELSRKVDRLIRSGAPVLVQEHPKGDILHFPPGEEAYRREILVQDGLHFNRRAHPLYTNPIPALEPVQFSIISHHGCLGACTFCALALHQGRRIRSRSPEKILKEISQFVSHPDFRGTVPDIGGPALNMYGWDCAQGGCEQGICAATTLCKQVRGSLKALDDLLRKARNIPGIRHVFLGSGLRYDLLRENDWKILASWLPLHISGQLKVAPEHVNHDILRLMRKGADSSFTSFLSRFANIVKASGVSRFLVPYFITAFPGANRKIEEELATFVQKHGLAHEQIQEFTPTPGTLATAMFHAETDWNGRKITVAKTDYDRSIGRRLLQSDTPERVGETRNNDRKYTSRRDKKGSSHARRKRKK